MFCILIQLTTLFYAIPMVELNHSDDAVIDYLYHSYGIYQIPPTNMNIFSEGIQLIGHSALTRNFRKLFVDLVTTHFVYRLEIKQMDGTGYGWTKPDPDVKFKKVLSDSLVPCPLGRSSSEFKEFICMALTRKLEFVNKPSDTIMEIHGREILIENYAGCFESKISSSSITENESEVSRHDSARECAVKCRGKSNYFGLNSEEKCLCIASKSEFMSVSSTLCGNCTNPLYICGSRTFYAVYTTKNARLQNMLNPPIFECLEDSSRCGDCVTGNKGYNCEFVDCSSTDGGCRLQCSSVTRMNEEFGFCTCPDGYVGEESRCKDYNECEDEHACSEHQICVNTAGSFTCSCHLGFLKDETGKCLDDDECKYATSCPEDQTCINIIGSFRCECNPGYKKDEFLNCLDIDECLIASTCGDSGQICTNTVGSYTCHCVPGYVIDEFGKCSDDDECKYATSCPDAICINIIGSFRCECNPGYEKDEFSNCLDIDECLIASTCGDSGQICTNTVGSYTCHCVPGYVIDEFGKCSDIDECKAIDTCDISSTVCRNNDGSYTCQCLTGFRYLSLTSCQDVDECGHHHTCDTNSTECVNIPSSFICSCLRGYHKMDWYRCSDDNECELPATSCPDGVPCVNLPGSFDCICPDGSSKMKYGHNTLCDDIDECEVPDICDSTSSFCLNTRPLYVCLCRKGYASVDNRTCVPSPDDANDMNGTTTMLSTGYPGEEHGGLDKFNISLIVLALSIVSVVFTIVYFFGKQSVNRKYSTTTSLTVVSSAS